MSTGHGVTMKDRVGTATPRPAGPAKRPGVYLSCSACGRLLNIQWATRSIVCACGARVSPAPAESK